jgi:hypothetical protein
MEDLGMSADKEYVTREDLNNLKKGIQDDLKEGLKSFKEEIVHQFHIISEDLRTQIKQVAEGVANVYEKSERDKAELKVRFGTDSLAVSGIAV